MVQRTRPAPPVHRIGGARPGFTLLELLTVVAVIGVLAAILIPVAGKVRFSARNAECVSNLRQVFIRHTSYVADNRGRIPRAHYTYTKPDGTSGSRDWTTMLSEKSEFQEEKAVFGCSEKRLELGASDPTRRTYSMNLGVNKLSASGDALERSPNVFEQPARTLLFADGNFGSSGTSYNAVIMPGRLPEFIHKGRANLVFLDGHVAAFAELAVPRTAPAGTAAHLFWYGVTTP